MFCEKHTDREAAGMCVYCGKPHCAECLVEVDGRMYCKEDLSNVIKEAKEQAARSAPAQPININNSSTNNNTNSNVNENVIGLGFTAVPTKSKITALILCLLGFFGLAGFHRFYVGKAGTGILYFLTFGFCLFGTIIDIISIITGGFRDSYGMPLI